jgi:hypothetical protein
VIGGNPSGALGAAARYTDTQYGYSFGPPPGWSRKEDIPRPYVAFLGPVDAGSQANFTIYPEPAANRSLAQYVKVARETIAKTGEMRLQSDRPAKLGGVRARVLQSLVTAKGHPAAISRQVVAVHGGRGYVVTFTAPPGAFKKYSPVFDSVISSFQWQR